MSPGSKQTLALPPSVDLARQTVITGRDVDRDGRVSIR